MEPSTMKMPAVLLPLANGWGKYAIVDAVDYPLVSGFKWRLNGQYVATKMGRDTVYLHRFLLGLKKGDGLETDHCSRDPLDNRKCNLRVVDRKTNVHNRHLRVRSESGVIGVCRERATGKWLAYAKRDGRYRNLGRFGVLEDAIAARQRFDEQWPLKPDMAGCRCTDAPSVVSYPIANN